MLPHNIVIRGRSECFVMLCCREISYYWFKTVEAYAFPLNQIVCFVGSLMGIGTRFCVEKSQWGRIFVKLVCQSMFKRCRTSEENSESMQVWKHCGKLCGEYSKRVSMENAFHAFYWLDVVCQRKKKTGLSQKHFKCIVIIRSSVGLHNVLFLLNDVH